MNYGVLMADIISSRSYNEETRYLVQKQVKMVINYLNKIYSKALKSEVEISSGDQVQGLFYEVEACYLYYRHFKMLMYPVGIRAGIGYGSLYFENDWKSNELDGPVYHNAKQSLDVSKKNKLEISFFSKTVEDKYLNMLLVSSANSESRETITTNLTSLFLEMIFPLQFKFYPSFDLMNHEIIEYIKEIITIKSKINNNLDKKSNTSFNINYDNLSNYLNLTRTPNIIEYLNTNEMLITEFWKKGYSTKVADIMNIKRQIVDRNFKYSNIELKRNIDASIVLYLAEKIQGK